MIPKKQWKSDMMYIVSGPEITYYPGTNKFKIVEFKRDNKPHNVEFPAFIYYHENGNVKYVWYRLYGKEYRNDNLPTFLNYLENGKILTEDYRTNSDSHIEIEYYDNGNISYKRFYSYENFHREDGPAIIGYFPNGNIKYEMYYLKGVPHRIEGFAFIEYDENGNILKEY